MKRLELKKILLILIGVVTITSCQKGNLLDEQKTLSTVKQQKFMEEISDEEFIIMTEAERQYLLESGESMTIDEFQNGLLILLPIITMGGDYIFVASTRDNYVFFEALSEDGKYESWYNRLNDHIYEHYEIYDTMTDSDSPSIKCLKTGDLKKIANWINEQIKNKRDFIAKYDLEKEEWFLCNGDCCKK